MEVNYTRKFVHVIRDFPIGCGPNPNLSPTTHHDGEFEPMMDYDDDLLDIIEEDVPREKPYLEFVKPGSGPTKRRASAIRSFPYGCGTGFSGYAYDYDEEEEEEPEYPDSLDLSYVEGEVNKEESVTCGARKPVDGGSCKEAGLIVAEITRVVGLGVEEEQSARTLVGDGGVVLALVAPKFCPWRDSNGRIRNMKRKRPRVALT